MADTMETLEIEVKHKASGAVTEIDKLADSLLRLNRYLAGTTIPKLEGMAKALGKIKNAEAKISNATGAKSSSAKTSGTVKEISDISEEMKDGIRHLKKYEVAWLKYHQEKDKMEKALAEGDAAGAVNARGRAIKARENYNKEYWDYFGEPEEQEEPANVFERIGNAISGVQDKLKGLTGGMEEVSKSAKKATKSTNKLVASFGRVMFYRAIRKVISEISKGFSEGLQNVYQFSSTIGSVISQTMDSFASLGLQMKNQLGSALGELLATIRPIVEFIIQIITKAADTISQFFAVLGGRSTYHKALDSSAQWAETTEKGAEAAKEWKNQLMGFDEINRLEAPADTGASASNNNKNNIGNFALTPVTMDFSWLDKIKEFFGNLNLDPIIQAVGRLMEVLGPFLENIGKMLMWIWDNILAPLIQWIVEELAPVLIDVFSSVLEVINSVMEVIGPVLQDIWENILSPIFEWIGETVLSVLEDLTGFLHDLSSLISGEITWDEFISGLSDTELLLGSVLTAFTLVYGAIGLFNAVMGIASTVTGIFSGVLAFFAANPAVLVALAIAGIIFVVLELIKHWDDMKNKLAEWEESLAEHVGNGKLEWEDFAYWVVVGIENVMRGIEKLFDWIGKLIDKLREAWKWLKKLLKSSDSFEYDYSADYDYGFSGYASGGFPDEGEMFVAREAGPEMVGTIGGRTAVATNADIVNAIKGGVYEAMAAALSTSGNRSGGGVVLNVNGREFMRAIWDDRNAVISEHGMSLITSG